ncbi:flavin-containing monooxygenase 5-like isoform X2 [Pelodiscus sinensis]|uniref:flavin-containing monooxygenase 5-like isoform X2 n=2 Tax=Pelodiscus sinensis TaxID=13735 RepID=UPI003F6D029A
MARKRIAVIGAGVCGLSSVKCCLDEGLEPTCFERSHDIGGLWRFEENPEEGRASIYKSVIINTSKEMMCFSDFPIPEDYPNYMHHSKVMEYFRMYAERFGLLRHVCFQTNVVSVTKRPDFSTSGQWDVVTETEGKQDSAVFDGVMVCTGHHTHAHLPLASFPGIDTFKGRFLHSRDYKEPQEFSGKRVVVVGIGSSGTDLAVELSHTAEQVFLSTRRGAWILGRVGEEGYPIDTIHVTRYEESLRRIAPLPLLNYFSEKKLNAKFNHALYGLQPAHRFSSQHPTFSDDLPNCIISGKVLVKTNIREFTETGAIFEDGTREEDIDVVVFATGYSFSFPFLRDCVSVMDNQVSLYKFTFPPQLEKPTLAFIGLIQVLGAVMPVAELQARWATRVFKGLSGLPSASDMEADIARKREEMAKRYVKSQRYTLQADYVPYMDEVACLAGVQPKLLSLFLTDPKLAMEVFFGPCTPYQYRLRGPGKWDGARNSILSQRERIIKPLKTRVLAKDTRTLEPRYLWIFPIVALAAVIFAYFQVLLFKP